MKIKLGGLAVIAGAALMLFAVPAHAQTPVTVNFTYIANTNIFGDGYVDPYIGTVKLQSGGGQVNPNGLIICDDFNDNIYIPETWNATALTAPQLTTLTPTQLDADTLFGSNIGLDGYAAVASLVSQLYSLNSNVPAQALTQADLSAAIWYITSGGIKTAGGGPNSFDGFIYSLEGYTLDSNAASYVAAALAAYGISPTGASAAALAELNASSNLWVLTPYAPYPVTYGPNGGRPQEMWIEVPEGGAALLYLLLAGGVCFGAMFLNHRNRFASLASA